MPSDRSEKFSKKQKISLRLVLIISFVSQIVSAVGLVGYLSYHRGQKAIEKLADELMAETSHRIEQHLDDYLGKAQEINQSNLDAFESGVLDLQDFNALGKYFYRQLRLFNFSYVNFGNEAGGFIGAGYGLKNQLEIGEILPFDPGHFRSHSVDQQGNRLNVDVIQNPGVNSSAWYVDARKAGKTIWSSIYIWEKPLVHISISASTPIYTTQKKFLGVLGIDLELSQISQFLKKLNTRRLGKIFIIERSGLMVASSEEESPAPLINGRLTRLKALNSHHPLIREVTQTLIQKFGNLQAISTPVLLRPKLPQKPYVRVIPYQDQYGLDWLVVMVVPESEFLTEIQTNSHVTIFLCLLTLIVAIGLGIITSNIIAEPILRLGQASRAIANGQLSQAIRARGFSELETLAGSFNEMSSQLQNALQTLENRVRERTAELLMARDKLELLATLDSLTQIANRRRFDDYIALEWHRHQREKMPLALLLIDIDYFKHYNDLYGHQRGDQCLIQVAQTIAKVPQRPTDLVARYGGEEFAVVLSNTHREGALTVAAAIQREIRALKILHGNSHVSDYVTLSIGVTSIIPTPDNSLANLIADADQALYTAKEQGRNRVVAAEV